MSTLLNVLLLFWALLLLLLIHELGHWVLARLCRVRVSALTLGLGPQLFTFEWPARVTLRLFPIAASIQYTQSEGRPGNNYLEAPPWKRTLIDLGGPVASYATASTIILLLSVTGFLSPVPRATVASVEPGSRAEQLGVVEGSPADSLEALNESAESLGVTLQRVRTPVSLGSALKLAVWVPVELTRDQLSALRGLAFRGESERMQGPVRVSRDLLVEAQRGFFSFASAMALVSIAVGFFNLLPIPGLDGGKVLFNVLEVVRGRALSPHVAGRIQAFALSFLLLVVAGLSARELSFPWLAVPAMLAFPVMLGALTGMLRRAASPSTHSAPATPRAKPWRRALAIGAALGLALALVAALVWGFWMGVLLAVPVMLLFAIAAALALAGHRWSSGWRLG
jgi:regulator of sigma E protease